MASSVAVEPGVLDFGAVAPGLSRKFVTLTAPSGASVTARIDGGEGRFRVDRIDVVESTERPMTPAEIAELPPHMQNDPRYHVTFDETVSGSSDGVAPLPVIRGQRVIVNVTFSGDVVAGDGVQSAVLSIIGTGWDAISVPVSGLVAEVTADVPAATLIVTQGETATLTVPIRSTLGPDTEVRFELEADSGLTMDPVSIFLPGGGQAQASLRIQAPRSAVPLRFRRSVRMSAFNGRQIMWLTFECQILPAPLTPEQSPASTQPIRADWWQWRGASSRNEQWMEDYFISGTFTNKGGSKVQDLAITIFEIFEDAANLTLDEANLGATEHGLVAPGQSAPGATAPIKKDWQWFIPGVWVVKGPTHKEFRYKALISAQDENGFPYPPVTSAELRVFVNVSGLKRSSGAFAMGAAAAAAVLLATIFLAPAGAAAYAAACAAGAVALDPPEPDHNYRERIPLPPLGDVPSSGPDRNTIRLFRLGERIMRIELTKSLIEGRRLGARAAQDAQWVETHTQDLAAATLLQRDLANEVRALEPQAKEEVLALVPPGTDLAGERERLMTTGLSTELADELQLAAEQRPGFDALLRSDVALSTSDIIGTIEATLSPLTDFTDSLD